MSLRSLLFPAKWRLFRLFLSLVYLGLLFSVAGYLYGEILFFEGDLFLDTDTPARWVVRQAGTSGAVFSAQHNLPASVILPSFESRIAARYGRDVSVDVASLNFALRLVSVEPIEEFPPREEVEIQGPGAARTEKVQIGKTLALDGANIQMVGVRPWAGLVRTPHGLPMACVTLPGGEDQPSIPVFLRADQWQTCGAALMLCFRWFPDQASAEKALPERLDDTGARWGVAEGKRVQAFTSFEPGMGVALEDGTEVMLLARREAENGHPSALIVETSRSGEVRRWTIEANRPVEGLSLFYDCPAEMKESVMLHGWRDGAVLAGCYRQGVLAIKQMLQEGAMLGESQTVTRLRLEQVLSKASAAKPDPNGAWQLTVDAGQGEIGLRQGMAVQVGDYRLIYHRAVPPPRLQYTLAMQTDTGVELKLSAKNRVILESGKKKRIGGWRITAPLEPIDLEQGLVMRAERTLGGPSSIFGAFLFIAGAFGWVLSYYWAPRRAR